MRDSSSSETMASLTRKDWIVLILNLATAGAFLAVALAIGSSVLFIGKNAGFNLIFKVMAIFVALIVVLFIYIFSQPVIEDMKHGNKKILTGAISGKGNKYMKDTWGNQPQYKIVNAIKIGDEAFRISKRDYKKCEVGNKVELHYAPSSRLVLQIRLMQP